MFYGAEPVIFERAGILRDQLTKAENILWISIKDSQILGLKFRRQHPIGQFITDFYCHKIKLVIEVDGKIHIKKSIKEYDEGRTYELEKLGLTVIRFRNDQIENDIDNVIALLEIICKDRLHKC